MNANTARMFRSQASASWRSREWEDCDRCGPPPASTARLAGADDRQAAALRRTHASRSAQPLPSELQCLNHPDRRGDARRFAASAQTTGHPDDPVERREPRLHGRRVDHDDGGHLPGSGETTRHLIGHQRTVTVAAQRDGPGRPRALDDVEISGRHLLDGRRGRLVARVQRSDRVERLLLIERVRQPPAIESAAVEIAVHEEERRPVLRSRTGSPAACRLRVQAPNRTWRGPRSSDAAAARRSARASRTALRRDRSSPRRAANGRRARKSRRRCRSVPSRAVAPRARSAPPPADRELRGRAARHPDCPGAPWSRSRSILPLAVTGTSRAQAIALGTMYVGSRAAAKAGYRRPAHQRRPQRMRRAGGAPRRQRHPQSRQSPTDDWRYAFDFFRFDAEPAKLDRRLVRPTNSMSPSALTRHRSPVRYNRPSPNGLGMNRAAVSSERP